MKRTLIICFILLFAGLSVFSQTGIIRGKVIDAETGESLIGATVVITGTTNGTISDFDGNYSLSDIPAGNQSVTISYVSYETIQIDNIEVKPGEVAIVNANLGAASLEIEEVKVVARMRQQTEAAVQVLQMKSANLMDGISTQQISRLGDSDAASALKRVTGVSIEGGKYVYVRGLSDRYTKTTLNGAEIPGLDPNRNTVQMDLFPANVIENMLVHKTFSPDLPSFSGGHVDIITKDFPERFTLNISASTTYNPVVHLNEDFLTYKTGNKDWHGKDDGTRDMPDVVKGIYIPLGITPSTIDTYETVTRSFNKYWDSKRSQIMPDQSYSFSLGNQVNLFGKPLGFITAASFQKKSSYWAEGEANSYDAISIDQMQAFETLNEEYGSQDIIWSGLANLSYKLSNNHKIGVTYMKNQNGISGARKRTGYQQYDDYNINKLILEYLERSLSSTQLKGKHVIPALNNTTINWLTSYTISVLREPDRREFVSQFRINEDVEPVDTTYEMIFNRRPTRRYRDMWEENWDTKLDLTVPVSFLGNQKSKFKTGFSYLAKHRSSDENYFNVSWRGTIGYNGVPSSFFDDDQLLSSESIYEGVYYSNDELTDQTNSYIGQEDVTSFYGMFDLYITPNLRTVFGLRYEHDEASIRNLVDTIAFDSPGQKAKFAFGSSDDKDFLPAISIIYTPKERMNVRFAYSKSTARPAFRERAPYGFYDYGLGAIVYGNPDLKRGLVDNIDVRWEYFFSPGQMVSLSGFYKYLRDPVERFAVQKTVDRIEYRNHTDGTIMGVELELRKDLNFIPLLKNFSFGTNLTFIDSHTDLDSARYELAVQIIPGFQETRPMYGQSPYLVNSYLNYNNTKLGIRANIAYNVQGEKIILISKFATPDVYEQPFAKLDFNISKRLWNNVTLKFKLENLLDSEFRQNYMLDGVEYIYRTYKPGRRFGVSLTYSID